MKNFFKTIGCGFVKAWDFFWECFWIALPWIILVAIVIGIVLGVSSCSHKKAEVTRVWNESKETVVYTTKIVDFTYNTIDDARDRTDFYVWYENSLGTETSSLIPAEDFIIYAHAFHEGLEIQIEAEVGIQKDKTTENLVSMSIVNNTNK